jgi:hypothetical protein
MGNRRATLVMSEFGNVYVDAENDRGADTAASASASASAPACTRCVYLDKQLQAANRLLAYGTGV